MSFDDRCVEMYLTFRKYMTEEKLLILAESNGCHSVMQMIKAMACNELILQGSKVGALHNLGMVVFAVTELVDNMFSAAKGSKHPDPEMMKTLHNAIAAKNLKSLIKHFPEVEKDSKEALDTIRSWGTPEEPSDSGTVH